MGVNAPAMGLLVGDQEKNLKILFIYKT